MDFFGISLFTVLQYLRIHEWNPLFGALHLVQLAVLCTIFGIVIRNNEFSIRSLLRTPHDFLVLAYFGWILYAAAYWRDAWDFLNAHFVGYFLFVLTLTNLVRLRRILALWTILLYILATLAVASEFGFDPFDTYDRTHGMWKGRLALHLAGVHNPNSLGHTVVPVLAAIYIYWIWKRPIFVKEIAIPLMAIPFACVFMTESKGAFLVGFLTLLVAFVFGRSRVVQIIVLVLALTTGITALYKLPRMDQMRNPRSDAGIRGRLDAFKFGIEAMKERRTGLGVQRFPYEFHRFSGIVMSPHSTYVGIGAELGYTGLLLYIALLYACGRTLVMARDLDPDEERVRRILLVFLAAKIASGWLINWSYHIPVFLLAGTTAAFHRYLLMKQTQKKSVEAEPMGASIPVPVPAIPLPAGTAGAALEVSKTGIDEALTMATDTPSRKPFWNRIGIIDVVLIWFLTRESIKFWEYIIRNF